MYIFLSIKKTALSNMKNGYHESNMNDLYNTIDILFTVYIKK